MLKTFLKFSFAIVLCYWLFKNGKLDFNLLIQAFHLGYLWVWGAIILTTRLFICALRFKLLLDTKSNHPTSYLKVFSFDAIGNLFSLVIPAGDLVRFIYFKNLDDKLTSGVIATLISLERLIGLLGLVALANIVSLAEYKILREMSPQVISLVFFNIAIFIAVSIFMLFIFSSWFPKKKIATLFATYFSHWPKANKILHDMLSIDLRFNTFLKCVLLSMLNHAVIFVSFLLFIAPFIPQEVSLYKIFPLLPIGFMGSAIPISPGGLGVGHLLFDNLFKLIEIKNGASLFNIYFVVNICVCLIGIIPYLFYKKGRESHF